MIRAGSGAGVSSTSGTTKAWVSWGSAIGWGGSVSCVEGSRPGTSVSPARGGATGGVEPGDAVAGVPAAAGPFADVAAVAGGVPVG